MKRPRIWLRWLLVICVLLMSAEYVTLTWFAPRYVVSAIQRAVGGELTIDRAQLALPLTTTFSGIHFAYNTPEAALSIKRAVVRPHWLSLSPTRLELESLDIERPLLRVTRTKMGTLLWPSLPTAPSSPPGSGRTKGTSWLPSMPSSWVIRTKSVKILDGTLDYIDETTPTLFHVVFDHLSLVVGPVSLPFREDQTSFAMRGVFAGHTGEPAPFYCSGWVGMVAKDLQIACQLDPLVLAMFEPYYQSPLTIRVYSATVKSTSQWIAQSNDLHARIQLELGNLAEGDLSVHGRTILDVKKLVEGGEPRLLGELNVHGPLDDPRQWHGEFLPGNDIAQKLVERLLERGVRVVKIPFWGGRLHVGISPASVIAMQDIEAVSKEISEALEILSTPAVSEVPPPAALPTSPTTSSTATSPEAMPASESKAPATAPSTQSTVPPEPAPSTPVPGPTPATTPPSRQAPSR